MKRNFNIAGMLVILICLVLMAATPADKYTYGKRSSVTLACDDSVTIEPNNLTCLVATMSVDTNCVIDADVDNSIIGDVIYLKLTSDATDRTVAWGDLIVGVDFTMQSSTTLEIQLVYDGAYFRQVPVPGFSKYSTSLTYNDTLSIDPNANNVSLFSCSLTGNVAYLNGVDTDNTAGDILILKFTASGANRQINFNTNFTAVDDSVLSGKTKVFQFVYDGSNFIETSEVQID